MKHPRQLFLKKTFDLALVPVGGLNRTWALFFKKIKTKSPKRVRQASFSGKFFKIPSKIDHKNLFLFVQISTLFNWALKRTWTLLRNFPFTTGRLFRPTAN